MPEESRMAESAPADERILQAAMRRFAVDGLGAPLRAVAQDAGVSAGLIIHHFGSREKLLEACDRRVLEVTVEQKRTYIHIKNSGEGIPKEEISKVFDRFYKTDRSRSMDKTGVGLGLYIVRQIVNLHQGEVIVRSVEGEYCEFSFSVATAPKALTKQPKPVDVREV